MANREHLQLLTAAVSSIDSRLWNRWRAEYPNLRPDLSDADLSNTDLCILNLSDANMCRSNLAGASLVGASLNGTDLTDAILCEADLRNADLKCAHLRRTDLSGANLTYADVRFADLRGVNLTDAKLFKARVSPAERERTHVINPRVDAEVLEQVESSMGATIGRLAKTALGLFKGKEAVALGLLEIKRAEDQSGRAGAGPPHAG
jgi:uncharacterized protein YjbI with pentapeptide repeats